MRLIQRADCLYCYLFHAAQLAKILFRKLMPPTCLVNVQKLTGHFSRGKETRALFIHTIVVTSYCVCCNFIASCTKGSVRNSWMSSGAFLVHLLSLSFDFLFWIIKQALMHLKMFLCIYIFSMIGIIYESKATFLLVYYGQDKICFLWIFCIVIKASAAHISYFACLVSFRFTYLLKCSFLP